MEDGQKVQKVKVVDIRLVAERENESGAVGGAGPASGQQHIGRRRCISVVVVARQRIHQHLDIAAQKSAGPAAGPHRGERVHAQVEAPGRRLASDDASARARVCVRARTV